MTEPVTTTGYVETVDPLTVLIPGRDETARPCHRSSAPAEVGMRGRVDIVGGVRYWGGEWDGDGIPVETRTRIDELGQSVRDLTEIENRTSQEVVQAEIRVEQALDEAGQAVAGMSEAKNKALEAFNEAMSAKTQASTVDGKYTVASADPTNADAQGKPPGAIWEVRSGTGSTPRRFMRNTNATWTAVKIGADQVGDKAIGRAQIGDLAVGTAQVADAAITDAKIGSLSVAKLVVTQGAKIPTAVIDTLIGDAAFFDKLHVEGVITVGGPNRIDGASMIKPGSMTANLFQGDVFEGKTFTGVNFFGSSFRGGLIVGTEVKTGDTGARIEIGKGNLNLPRVAAYLSDGLLADFSFHGIRLFGTRDENKEPSVRMIAKASSTTEDFLMWGPLPSGGTLGYDQQYMKMEARNGCSRFLISVPNASGVDSVLYFKGDDSTLEISARGGVQINGKSVKGNQDTGWVKTYPRLAYTGDVQYRVINGVVFWKGFFEFGQIGSTWVAVLDVPDAAQPEGTVADVGTRYGTTVGGIKIQGGVMYVRNLTSTNVGFDANINPYPAKTTP